MATCVRSPESVATAEATFATQAKAAKITEAFQKWIFADDTRRDVLVAEFNRRFNSLVAPKHRGDHLTLPGLSNKFNPHPYQRDAVALVASQDGRFTVLVWSPCEERIHAHRVETLLL